MSRRRMLWGGVIAGAVLAASVAIAAAVGAATSPERPVREYLEALAADDLATAAALAGLDAAELERLGGMPLGDTGLADVVEIVEVSAGPGPGADADADERVVTARYGERGVDVIRVAFDVRRTAFGPFSAWELADPPIDRVGVAADRHDEVVVNGDRRRTEIAGAPVAVAGFIPARLEAGIASPYLDGAAVRARFGTASTARPIVIAVTPSPRLVRLVDRGVASFLEECVAQPVLQPAGCPFGITVPDRVLGEPEWRVGVPPVATVVPSDRADEWAIEAGATMRVRLEVQRLIDGVVEERDEAVVAVITGTVRIGDDEVELAFAPPEE